MDLENELALDPRSMVDSLAFRESEVVIIGRPVRNVEQIYRRTGSRKFLLECPGQAPADTTDPYP